MRYLTLLSLTLFVLFFSGCGLSNKSMILHKDTIKNNNLESNYKFYVKDIESSGDLPNVAMHSFVISDKDIKNALIDNIKNNFNIANSENGAYSISAKLNFKRLSAMFDKETYIGLNGIYTIVSFNGKKVINVDSKYFSGNKITAGKTLIKGLFGAKFEKKATSNMTLEETAYAVDDSIVLSAYDASKRTQAAYAAAIRLNFAKFIQELNNNPELFKN